MPNIESIYFTTYLDHNKFFYQTKSKTELLSKRDINEELKESDIQVSINKEDIDENSQSSDEVFKLV